jgi:ketosteroid isomerase-like protein
MSPRDMSTHEEIRQLAYRYAEAVDSRDLPALVELFVDDVRVGRDRYGRDALAEWFDGVLRTFGVSIHFVGNHRITLEDQTHASGVVYCRAEHEVGDAWVVMMIQYWDTYERRDGAWLFRRRREKVWYGTDHRHTPAGELKDRWPGRAPAEAALPGAWPSWNQFWRRPAEAPD